MCLTGFTLCIFFILSTGPHRDLHSFPTRRSSDLVRVLEYRNQALTHNRMIVRDQHPDHCEIGTRATTREPHAPELCNRSEEHTSELQSHVNLVCRLLLEKKKKIYTNIQIQQ